MTDNWRTSDCEGLINEEQLIVGLIIKEQVQLKRTDN